MKNSLLELQQQRSLLRARIASQRATLAQQLEPLQQVSDAGQRLVTLARSGVAYLKSHPLPVLLALSALVLLKPRRAWRWLGRGVALWRSWKLLRAWLPSTLLGRWLR
jgi:hypothetical protein